MKARERPLSRNQRVSSIPTQATPAAIRWVEIRFAPERCNIVLAFLRIISDISVVTEITVIDWKGTEL
jgi:hypothetical protein